MNLHENRKLFSEAIIAASQAKEDGGLGVKQMFVEKDYWITRSLKLLAESAYSELTVFKGGTSLSKAYGIGSRFSEDVDIAVVDDANRTDNQTKSIVSGVCHVMSDGLEELPTPNTRKFSKYRKVYFQYSQKDVLSMYGTIKSGVIQFEIVSFTNPYPYNSCEIGSLLRDFLLLHGREDIIAKYGMESFRINVLDYNRTATEKTVSLIRQSLSDNFMSDLRAKIRHFYDLHFLWNEPKCQDYLKGQQFKDDFRKLLAEDQKRFSEPYGWNTKSIAGSPLLFNFSDIWNDLSKVYEKELSELAYRSVPKASEIYLSISQIFDNLKTI